MIRLDILKRLGVKRFLIILIAVNIVTGKYYLNDTKICGFQVTKWDFTGQLRVEKTSWSRYASRKTYIQRLTHRHTDTETENKKTKTIWDLILRPDWTLNCPLLGHCSTYQTGANYHNEQNQKEINQPSNSRNVSTYWAQIGFK